MTQKAVIARCRTTEIVSVSFREPESNGSNTCVLTLCFLDSSRDFDKAHVQPRLFTNCPRRSRQFMTVENVIY